MLSSRNSFLTLCPSVNTDGHRVSFRIGYKLADNRPASKYFADRLI
jgi:hypothetical protein